MTIQRWRFSIIAGKLAGTQSNPPPGDPPAILGTPENGEYIALEDFEAVCLQVQQMAAGLEDISAQLQRVIGAG